MLFSDVNFSLAPGTLLQVEGPNGSGKTSLLRILCRLMEPQGGQVLWQNQNIRALDEEYSRFFTYLGHRNAVKEELTPIENLRISCGLSGTSITREHALDALKRVGLESRRNLPTRFLSEGQKRRSALARLIASDAVLWILDEVLAALDAEAMSLVRSLISEHLGKGGIAVVATHQELQISGGALQKLNLGDAVSRSADALESTL